MFMKIKNVIFGCLAIAGSVSTSHAQVNFEIVSSTASPLLNSEFVITAQNVDPDADAVTLVSSGGEAYTDTERPFEWTLKIDVNSSLQQSYAAMAQLPLRLALSNKLDVMAVLSQPLTQLTFEPAGELVIYSGQKRRLSYIGDFGDGVNILFSGAGYGVSYSERTVDAGVIEDVDSPSISVSDDGVVVGLRPGVAEVVATVGDYSVSRRVIVRPVFDGDSDGDSLPDQVEMSIGTNAYNPDSDFDDVPDDVEIGNAANPNNVNGDRAIDALQDSVVIVSGTPSPIGVSREVDGLFSSRIRFVDQLPELPAGVSSEDLDLGSFTTPRVASPLGVSRTLYYSETEREVVNAYGLIDGVLVPIEYEALNSASTTVTLPKGSSGFTFQFRDPEVVTPPTKVCSLLGNGPRRRDIDVFRLPSEARSKVTINYEQEEKGKSLLGIYTLVKRRGRWVSSFKHKLLRKSSSFKVSVGPKKKVYLLLTELTGFRKAYNGPYCFSVQDEGVETSLMPIYSVE